MSQYTLADAASLVMGREYTEQQQNHTSNFGHAEPFRVNATILTKEGTACTFK